MPLNSDKRDNVFNGVYPKVPSNTQTGDLSWPRHLIGFAQRTVHPREDSNCVDPVMASVKLYGSFPHNDADMIAHVSSIRFITDPHVLAWYGR
jgi:hypothetical protein